MRKLKIFITILLLYEFAILTILQVPNYCLAFFNYNFCAVSFRYFLLCFVLPSLVGLFAWWLPEISRLFCKKCECEMRPEPAPTTRQYIEKLVMALAIVAVQKFISRRPKIKKILDDILEEVSGKK